MPREERRERMRLMRRTVMDNNVYRWAGNMLLDVAQVRRRQGLAGGLADTEHPSQTRPRPDCGRPPLRRRPDSAEASPSA